MQILKQVFTLTHKLEQDCIYLQAMLGHIRPHKIELENPHKEISGSLKINSSVNGYRDLYTSSSTLNPRWFNLPVPLSTGEVIE